MSPFPTCKTLAKEHKQNNGLSVHAPFHSSDTNEIWIRTVQKSCNKQ